MVCLDSFLTGRMENIEPFLQNPQFRLIRQDVISPITVDGPVDRIFNMACAASPPKYQRDPIHTFKTSVMGTMNLLELAREKGARMLLASTSEVYGDPEIAVQPETYRGNVNTVGPRSCYDEGKRAAETLMHDYAEAYGVETRIARIFNTYGPGMCPEDGRVVSNFIMQALQGDPITVYGDGGQTRSFCFVSDLVAGLVALMEAEGKSLDPVNLGNPEEITVRELAEIILAKVATMSNLEFSPLPKDDPMRRRPDIGRARAVLDWAPEVALDVGLEATIPYFADQLSRVAAVRIGAE